MSEGESEEEGVREGRRKKGGRGKRGKADVHRFKRSNSPYNLIDGLVWLQLY